MNVSKIEFTNKNEPKKTKQYLLELASGVLCGSSSLKQTFIHSLGSSSEKCDWDGHQIGMQQLASAEKNHDQTR